MTRTLDRAGAAQLASELERPSVRAGTAFSTERREALRLIAERLAADRVLGAHPEVRAFAFSIRPAEIERLARAFEALATADSILTPRGVVLHFAPANVDTVGLYSWLWAFLTGNASVVRVSARRTATASALENSISGVLEQSGSLALSNHWVSYPHDEEITATISGAADVRMIWGGDRAVAEIRAIPTRPATVDLVFRDRLSIAILDGAAIAALDDKVLGTMASRFAADLVMFHQAACSSPRTVFWVAASDEVKARWWTAVAGDLARRGYSPPEGAAIRKLGAATVAAAEGRVRGVRALAPGLTVMTGAEGPLVDHHCGWGLVEERDVRSLADAAAFLDARVQTVATLGFAPEDLAQFGPVAARRGVDRLVSIGRALEFGRYWDGHDLLLALSRRVGVQAAVL